MKNIELLKEEITEILLTSKKDGTNYFYYRDLKEKIHNAIDQLDEPEVKQLYEKIRELETFNDELIRDNNQFRNELDNQEVLSSEWIKNNQRMWTSIHGVEYYIPTNKLYEKVVPKKELPAIPQFVADFLDGKEEYALYELFDNDLIHDNYDELASWLYDNDEETNKERELSLVLAQKYGYIIEKEQQYYARIKGWKNVTTGSEAFNWVYFKEEDTVGISKAVENKYQSVSFTKYDWNNLGINEHNADFVLVEEME